MHASVSLWTREYQNDRRQQGSGLLVEKVLYLVPHFLGIEFDNQHYRLLLQVGTFRIHANFIQRRPLSFFRTIFLVYPMSRFQITLWYHGWQKLFERWIKVVLLDRDCYDSLYYFESYTKCLLLSWILAISEIVQRREGLCWWLPCCGRKWVAMYLPCT